MPATSNRIAMRYRAETTYGVAETGEKFTNLRLVSESLKKETTTVISQELRSDRQIADVIRTGISASGDVNGEFSYGAYDDLLAAALMSAGWSSAVTIAAGTDVAFGAPSGGIQTITKTAGGFDDFDVGSWVKISGAAAAGNNGVFKIAAIASDTSMTVYNPGGASATAGASIGLVQGAQIVNGVTQTSFNIEKEFTELSNEFELGVGMMADTLGVTITADALVTLVFGFVGKSMASAAATTGDGSPTAAPTNDVMNAIDHVAAIYEGATAETDVTQLNFTLNNGLRPRLQVGTLGAVSVGEGTVNVTGTLQQFYETKTLMDKHLNMTPTSLAVVFTDGAGNSCVIEFPRLKFTSGQRVAGGLNQDIIADMQFTAYRHPTEDVTIRIQRFAAA